MPRIFIDMDGVIVDFDSYVSDRLIDVESVKHDPGHYISMPPLAGAIDSIKYLIAKGYDIWVATKPPTGAFHAYAEKAEWICKYLPDLRRKIIITHDKGLLGDDNDILIDDKPHRANCESFKGKVIKFNPFNENEWKLTVSKVEAELSV